LKFWNAYGGVGGAGRREEVDPAGEHHIAHERQVDRRRFGHDLLVKRGQSIV